MNFKMYKKIFSWLLRIIIAILFLQTLSFKFTAHPDSVYIFSKLGVEPYGRVALGIIELITSLLILIPRTKLVGILFSFFIILGAIASHFFVIGIEIKGDGGGLLLYAFIIFIACVLLFILYRKEFQKVLFKKG